MDGDFPNPGLLLGSDNFYATAFGGGITGYGKIFKIGVSGEETVLYSFPGPYSTGEGGPNRGLIQDGNFNLYSTSLLGGVFQLDPLGNFTVLALLDGSTVAPLILDQNHIFYGVTSVGGGIAHCGDGLTEPCGSVFEMFDNGTRLTFYEFSGDADGGTPVAGLVMGPDGTLYGTTGYGGIVNDACPVGCGVVFKITR